MVQDAAKLEKVYKIIVGSVTLFILEWLLRQKKAEKEE
jgi:hypothetical protein